MPLQLGNLHFYLGPKAAGAPDDLEAPIIEAIDNATSTVYLATQQLECLGIINALITARKRGIRVRAILERDYLLSRSPRKEPWEQGGSNEDNRQALIALFRAKVDIRIDRSSRTLHNNFLVIDHRKKGLGTVITTSANLTPRGVGLHYNHLLIIKDDKVAKDFYQEFDAIWEDDPRFSHGDTPVEIMVNEIRVKPIFAPNHAPEMELMKQIAKAKERIDFAIYSFSKSSGVDDAMKLASRAGTSIRGIFDKNQANQRWAAKYELEAEGIEVFSSTGKNWRGKVHHKLVVIDNSIVIAGTFNFSQAANFNEEVLVVLGDLEAESDSTINQQAELVAFARAEIDRLILEA